MDRSSNTEYRTSLADDRPTDFTAWLLRQHRRNDPVGDLARDFRRDPDRPTMATVQELRDYIDGASHGWDLVVAAFDRAVAEWRKEVA